MRVACPVLRAMPAGWSMQTHLELAALPSAVACVRGHVRAVAHEWGLADLADIAELLVSELVTNALRASGRLTTAGLPVVRLWVVCDQVSLVIQVWDGHEEMPVCRDAAPEAESGRGLMLVNSLAKDWGAYREASGKVVWVML
jgi:anti-sigma regulatory factor (Ser/Thr protein kinase)